MRSWIDKLERRFKRYSIRELMKYIVIITGFVYAINLLLPSGNIMYKLMLIPQDVLHGEVWRLITYVFIPPVTDVSATSMFFAVIALYFYYMIGMSLEHEWGSFRFNLYYFIAVIGTILATFITGGVGTATYINLSLFLAFAHIYPDYEILLFFILPVKMKYLGWLSWAYIILTILTAPLAAKAAAVISIINYFIFFGKDIITYIRRGKKVHSNRNKFRGQIPNRPLVHTCTVCGLTQDDDPNMDFRYCPECDGRHCYCSEHIRNHEHIKINKVIDFPGKKQD